VTPRKRPPKPRLIAVAGGTASGKTSFARKVRELAGERRSILLELDAYYNDLSHMPLEERHTVDFDRPGAFDFDLLKKHLKELLAGREIDVPIYDYVQHNRRPDTVRVAPRPWILVEGILVLWRPDVRELFDLTVYVDTPDDLRLLRRIRRDTLERGRALDGILRQYEHHVRPAHLEFCEPTKAHADVIIPRGVENARALALLESYLRREKAR